MASTNTASAVSAIGGALIWGTLGPVAALLDGSDRLAVGALRLLLGALALLVIGRGRVSWRGWQRRDLLALVVGAVGVAGFQIGYFGAVGTAGVAVSTAVGIGLSPVFTGCWAALRTGQRLSARWLAGTAVAVAGLAALAFGGGPHAPVSLLGLGLSVLAAASFSMQVGAIQILAGRHGETSALIALLVCGAVLALPATVLAVTPALLTAKGIACTVYLGVCTTALSYWLFSRGVRHIGAATATTVGLLEPVAAAVIAATVLHQPVTWPQWAGIGAICAAVLAISLRPPQRAGRRRVPLAASV